MTTEEDRYKIRGIADNHPAQKEFDKYMHKKALREKGQFERRLHGKHWKDCPDITCSDSCKFKSYTCLVLSAYEQGKKDTILEMKGKSYYNLGKKDGEIKAYKDAEKKALNLYKQSQIDRPRERNCDKDSGKLFYYFEKKLKELRGK